MPARKTAEPHTGRVALVTGAARGIGQAIAVSLAERGARIVLGDIDNVSETSKLIGDTGRPAVPVTLDVSDSSSIEAARDRVTDALGRVDIHVQGVSAAHAWTWLGPGHQCRFGNGRHREPSLDRVPHKQDGRDRLHSCTVSHAGRRGDHHLSMAQFWHPPGG